jgi:hypothetical protein
VPAKLALTGVVVAGASFAAVNVIVVGLFGVTVMVDGDTVTPVGRPLTATMIVPLKSPSAVLLSFTCALAPGVNVNVLGAAVSVKSTPGGGFTTVVAVTVSATEVFALTLPDAPYTFTVLVPTAAPAAAVSLNVALVPIVTVAFAGETVTPDGKPLTET